MNNNVLAFAFTGPKSMEAANLQTGQRTTDIKEFQSWMDKDTVILCNNASIAPHLVQRAFDGVRIGPLRWCDIKVYQDYIGEVKYDEDKKTSFTLDQLVSKYRDTLPVPDKQEILRWNFVQSINKQGYKIDRTFLNSLDKYCTQYRSELAREFPALENDTSFLAWLRQQEPSIPQNKMPKNAGRKALEEFSDKHFLSPDT